MKPTKNRVFCYDCNRPKMLFKTEKQAMNFIKFNADEIREETGYAPTRAYFCEACGGWHVTSMEEFDNSIRTHTQAVIIKYEREMEALHRKAEKKKKDEPAFADKVLMASLEKCLAKAEACIDEDNIALAKNYCCCVIDRLKNNMAYIEDAVRYNNLMERLTRCVDNCQTAKYWLKKANAAADLALWHLKYTTFAQADKSFHEGINYLSKACQLEGEDAAKLDTLQKLDDIQTKLKEAIAWYEKSA